MKNLLTETGLLMEAATVRERLPTGAEMDSLGI
jgi:hypothetical protein